MRLKLTVLVLFLLAFANAGLGLSAPGGSVGVDDDALRGIRERYVSQMPNAGRELPNTSGQLFGHYDIYLLPVNRDGD